MITIEKIKTKNVDEARYRLIYWFKKQRYFVYSDKGMTIASEKAARKLAAAIDHDLTSNPHNFNPNKYKTASSKLWLFKNQFQIWISGKAQTVKPHTVKTYELHARLYILPFFGDLEIQEIVPAHCLKFLSTLPSHLSAWSKKHIFKVLKMFLIHCADLDLITKIPKMPSIKTPERNVPWADHETQSKVLALIPPKHQPIFHFAMRHGMRIGEVIALQIKDINLKSIPKEIIIHHAISHDGESCTKTGTNRKIPINPELIESITSLCALKHRDSYLFTNNGIPYSGDYFSKIAKKATQKLGLKISAYELVRHSYLTQAGLRKVDPLILQKYAGHAKFSTTQKYLNLDTLNLSCVHAPAPVIQLPLSEKKEAKES